MENYPQQDILNFCYEHYLNTNSLVSYIQYPLVDADKSKAIAHVSHLVDAGYLEVVGTPGNGAVYVRLTDYALSCFNKYDGL